MWAVAILGAAFGASFAVAALSGWALLKLIIHGLAWSADRRDILFSSYRKELFRLSSVPVEENGRSDR